jgi:hypothetical protein
MFRGWYNFLIFQTLSRTSLTCFQKLGEHGRADNLIRYFYHPMQSGCIMLWNCCWVKGFICHKHTRKCFWCVRQINFLLNKIHSPETRVLHNALIRYAIVNSNSYHDELALTITIALCRNFLYICNTKNLNLWTYITIFPSIAPIQL